MYPVKKFRRRQTVRWAAMAVALGFSAARGSRARADNVFIGFNNATWNSNSAIWSAGTPTDGQVVDLFKTANVNYAPPTVPALNTLQLSGATASGLSALFIPSGYNLTTANLQLGPGATSNTAGGPGEIVQSGGQVTGTSSSPLLVNVDSVSTYALSSSGILNAGTEQLAGFFTENSGTNELAAGGILTNSGTYTIFNNGALDCDSIANSGTFNQSVGAVLQGVTAPTTSFTNNGTYLYSGGTFTGYMTNNLGGLVSVSTAAIPFSQGILDNGQLNVNSTGLNASTGIYSRPITGTGRMVFSGTGITTLTGTNSFTGSTSVTGGTLVLSSPVGVAGNNFGGALQGSISVGSAGTLQTTAASQIGNTATLNVNGGNVNLLGQDQTVGSVTMTGGQIQTTGVGLGVNSGMVTVSRGSPSIIGGLRSSSTFTFNVSNNATLTVANSISGYNAATGLVLTGGGLLSVYASSQLSTIDVQQGILQIAEGGSFGGANLSTTVESGGTLSLNNQPLTIGDLIGTGTVSQGTGTLTIGSIAGSTFGGTIYGSGPLIKSGSGTLTLSGTDASTGTTTVSAGTLIVTGTINGVGTVTVNAGAGLAGTGSITGPVNVSGNISTGVTTNTPGKTAAVLTVGTGSLLSGSLFEDLTAINTSDELVFSSGSSGTVTLGGSLKVTNPNSIAFAAGQSYQLLGFGGNTESGTFGTVTLPTLPSSLAWNTSSLYTSGFITIGAGTVIVNGPASLNWTNAAGTGAWNIASDANWNNSAGAVVTYSDTSNSALSAGDNVSFTDNNGGNYAVTLNTVVHPTSVLVNNSLGNYTLSGTGSIAGPGGLTKTGSSALTINTVNSYTGPTNISGGTVTLGVAGALPTGTNLTIGSGATVFVKNVGNSVAVSVGSLSVAGKFDLNNNSLVVHSSTLTAINALVKSGYNSGGWNGTTGIDSSAASANSLTALGVIVNDNGSGSPLYGSGGTLASTFSGASPTDGDVLVKYTYYGDTNLDGKVDGSDYSRIDSSFLSENFVNGLPTSPMSGWYNGDFNYDGVVNGSDYTLIDNAFNTQGAILADIVATPTAQIAGNSSVPEPASIAILGIPMLALLKRRGAGRFSFATADD
jgi:autotransporter-associated beta strand protein